MGRALRDLQLARFTGSHFVSVDGRVERIMTKTSIGKGGEGFYASSTGVGHELDSCGMGSRKRERLKWSLICKLCRV